MIEWFEYALIDFWVDIAEVGGEEADFNNLVDIAINMDDEREK